MRRTGTLLFIAFLVATPASPQQGMPVGPEFRVNTYTPGFQAGPSVASNSAGDFVVVWGGPDAADFGVFGRVYDSSGVPMGNEFRVNTYQFSFQYSVDVAFQSSDDFVVVWTSYGQDGSASGVFGQRYANFGSPLGAEFRINTFVFGGQKWPSVASDSSGNVVVVWMSEQQDGPFNIFGQRFDISGAPLGPEFRVNTFTPSTQNTPSVASDPAGNFVVVWESVQDGSSLGVFGQRYASTGAPLDPEFRVNSYTTGNQYRPSVASDSAGNFVVVWESNGQDGSYHGIYGQRFASSGAPLGPEFRVNTFTTSYQARTSVATDPAGNFVVVWRSLLQDGSGWGVFGQRFAASGIPLGPEFRVNTHTTSSQESPAVAADSSGEFVVTWTGSLQDGSDTGIFGQRYGQIVPVELMRFGVE